MNLDQQFQEQRRLAMADLASFENLDPAAAAQHRLEALNRALPYAYEHSPFYRKLQRHWGLPPQVACFDHLARFPFTTKEDLRQEYPFGFLAVSPDELIRYGESTGTTGPPTASFITYGDWIRGNVWVEKMLEPAFSAKDTAFIAIPYELTFASFDLDRALEHLGVTLVAVGTLNQICPFERLVEMMWATRPTTLVCTPTRALRLYDLLESKGYPPLEAGLEKLLYVGETCAPAKLEKIARLWQVELFSAYGSTETNSLALQSCGDGGAGPPGELLLADDRYHFEVIDPVSGTLLSDGELGELVITSLSSQAMPLIRYRTGDLVQISTTAAEVGGPRRVLRHLGRVCEQLSVDGREIVKLNLEEVVLSTPGSGLYWAAGVRQDRLTVRLEIAPGHDAEAVCARVRARVDETFRLASAVAPVDKTSVIAAMDRMLKPGSLELDDLECAA